MEQKKTISISFSDKKLKRIKNEEKDRSFKQNQPRIPVNKMSFSKRKASDESLERWASQESDVPEERIEY